MNTENKVGGWYIEQSTCLQLIITSSDHLINQFAEQTNQRRIISFYQYTYSGLFVRGLWRGRQAVEITYEWTPVSVQIYVWSEDDFRSCLMVFHQYSVSPLPSSLSISTHSVSPSPSHRGLGGAIWLENETNHLPTCPMWCYVCISKGRAAACRAWIIYAPWSVAAAMARPGTDSWVIYTWEVLHPRGTPTSDQPTYISPGALPPPPCSAAK